MEPRAPNPAGVEPKAIELVGPRQLRIAWKDGTAGDFEARTLRLACPCAMCVEEWSGHRILREESVAEDISLVHVELVGRYALNFTWSDGHCTGIFSWAYLRGLAGATGNASPPDPR